MLRILSLFQQKTHYLEKFLGVNTEAVEKFEIGDFTQLESFYRVREDILDVLNYIDSQMSSAQSQIGKLTGADKKSLEGILKKKDELVEKILNIDLRVLAAIDKEKSLIIKELQDVKKSKDVIGKYKSGIMNHRLDEKA